MVVTNNKLLWRSDVLPASPSLGHFSRANTCLLFPGFSAPSRHKCTAQPVMSSAIIITEVINGLEGMSQRTYRSMSADLCVGGIPHFPRNFRSLTKVCNRSLERLWLVQPSTCYIGFGFPYCGLSFARERLYLRFTKKNLINPVDPRCRNQ